MPEVTIPIELLNGVGGVLLLLLLLACDMNFKCIILTAK